MELVLISVFFSNSTSFLSFLSAGPKDMSALGTTLSQGANLHTLDLSDHSIRAAGGMTLLQSLQVSVVRLVLDGCFQEEADLPPFAQVLLCSLPLLLLLSLLLLLTLPPFNFLLSQFNLSII